MEYKNRRSFLKAGTTLGASLMATLPRYTPEAIKANWSLIEVLSEFGNQRGLTPSQVSLTNQNCWRSLSWRKGEIVIDKNTYFLEPCRL